jgi:hypothetical protein
MKDSNLIDAKIELNLISKNLELLNQRVSTISKHLDKLESKTDLINETHTKMKATGTTIYFIAALMMGGCGWIIKHVYFTMQDIDTRQGQNISILEQDVTLMKQEFNTIKSFIGVKHHGKNN